MKGELATQCLAKDAGKPEISRLGGEGGCVFGRNKRAELMAEEWKPNRVRCQTLSFWLRVCFS